MKRSLNSMAYFSARTIFEHVVSAALLQQIIGIDGGFDEKDLEKIATKSADAAALFDSMFSEGDDSPSNDENTGDQTITNMLEEALKSSTDPAENGKNENRS